MLSQTNREPSRSESIYGVRNIQPRTVSDTITGEMGQFSLNTGEKN
jgi:hypothetical protein